VAGETETIECLVRVPDGVDATVRRVGYVPLDHFAPDTPVDELDGVGYLPGLVPDPLFPETRITAGAFETHAFWVTLRLAVDASPTAHQVRIAVRNNAGEEVGLDVVVIGHQAILPARTDFHVTQWLYADALGDWYGTRLFGQRFWGVLRPYLEDCAGHGVDTSYVPLFTPPLDGVKRPTQLLYVDDDPGGLRFDWSMVRHWIEQCRSAGITTFEWTHLFSQWGAGNAIRVYREHGASGQLLWGPATSATSEEYEAFLGQFLPEFERFLTVEGLLGSSLFHLSDEPSGETGIAGYRVARQLVAKLAPWMRVIDALTDLRLAEEGLVDEPVALLPSVQEFIGGGFPTWAYFCCIPRGRYLNRLLDTPLTKVRMAGWLFASMGVKGFLHWGYNYWYRRQTTQLIDPFRVADGGAWPHWPAGDAFQVYPGTTGPIDSMRWEVFAESLQDLALLQHSGLTRDQDVFAPVRSFEDFPRGEAWIESARHTVLDAVARRQA
jgi:hypothetical protein